MQIKVGQLLEMNQAIKNLMGAKVEAYAAYKLRKFIRTAIDELTAIEEQRVELVKKYGTEIPGSNGQMQVQPDQMDAFNAEWLKLLEEEVTLPTTTIKISALTQAGLTVGDIFNLDLIIEDDSTPETPVS